MNAIDHFRRFEGHLAEFAPQGNCLPSQALPGTAAKLEELRLRIEAGLPLWHQGDRRYFDDGPEEEAVAGGGVPLPYARYGRRNLKAGEMA